MSRTGHVRLNLPCLRASVPRLGRAPHARETRGAWRKGLEHLARRPGHGPVLPPPAIRRWTMSSWWAPLSISGTKAYRSTGRSLSSGADSTASQFPLGNGVSLGHHQVTSRSLRSDFSFVEARTPVAPTPPSQIPADDIPAPGFALAGARLRTRTQPGPREIPGVVFRASTCGIILPCPDC